MVDIYFTYIALKKKEMSTIFFFEGVELKGIFFVKNTLSHGRGDMKFVVDGSGDVGNLDVSADTRMTLTYDGNVGIGNDGPANGLEVSRSSGSPAIEISCWSAKSREKLLNMILHR